MSKRSSPPGRPESFMQGNELREHYSVHLDLPVGRRLMLRKDTPNARG